MARSRNIKPGFFKNEDLVTLPYETRLLFIGLWCLADREGRLEDRPQRMKMEIFPADNIDLKKGLDALVRTKFLTRYEVEGTKYLLINNFKKHQHPHHKEGPSTLPAPELGVMHECETLGIGAIHEELERAKASASPSDSLIPDSLQSDSLQKISPPPEAQAIAPANDLIGEPITRANGSAPDCPYQAIAEAYHAELPELPSIVVLTPSRKRTLQARWREVCTADHLDAAHGIEFFRDFFRRIKQSEFLIGKAPPKPGGRSFRADFDWIFNPANFIKIVEGRYHGRRH